MPLGLFALLIVSYLILVAYSSKHGDDWLQQWEQRQAVRFSKAFYNLWKLVNHVKGDEDDFTKILELVESESQRERALSDRMMALKAAFPEGYRQPESLYRDFENAKQFRARMKKASLFLHALSIMDSLEIFSGYQQFLVELRNQISQEVSKRALEGAGGKRKQADINADISSLPDMWQLKELYQQTIANQGSPSSNQAV